MNNTKILFLLAFLASSFLASAQQDIKQYLKKNDIDAKEKYGLSYTIEKAGKSRIPKKGDYVKVNYKAQLLDGTVFDQTDKEAFIFQVGYGQVIRGLDVGITLFQTGSAGRLFIPSDMAYGRAGVNKTIPPNANLIFTVELLDVMSFQEYDAYMVQLEKKERQAYLQHIKEQAVKDLKLINDYTISNKIKAKRTASGLSYAITKKGKGAPPKAGDIIKVTYEGTLLDGTPFEKGAKKKTYEFQLGAGKVIPGWDEGFTYFNKNAEGVLIVPSNLAYGPRSIEEENISIPSDAIIVFNIKVLEIRRDSDAQTRR